MLNKSPENVLAKSSFVLESFCLNEGKERTAMIPWIFPNNFLVQFQLKVFEPPPPKTLKYCNEKERMGVVTLIKIHHVIRR